jgi:outer membrane protein, multidrug efflux system
VTFVFPDVLIEPVEAATIPIREDNVEQALIAVEQTTAQVRIQENVVKDSRRAFTLSEQQMASGTVNIRPASEIVTTLANLKALLNQ